MLMALGIKLIDTMTTGQQVLSGFHNVDYDVILCNFDLGKGRSGQDLLEELRQKQLLKFTSLFFIVSAEVRKDNVMGTIENEPDGYIVKPITTANLKKRLTEKLSQKDATRNICQAIDSGNHVKAIELCNEKILNKDRYSIWCMKTAAWLYSKQGNDKEALRIYEQAATKYKQDWALFGIAKIKKDTHNLNQSKEVLTTLLAKSPDRIEAYDLLAEIHLEQGNPNDAQKLLEHAISSSPNSVLRQRALAEVYINNNQVDKAINTLKKVIKLSEKSVHASPEAYLDFASCLSLSSKDDLSAKGKQKAKDAEDALTKANKLFPDTPELAQKSKLIEAKIHFAQSRTESAEQILKDINSVNKQASINLSLQLADTLYFMGNHELADTTLKNIAIPKKDNNNIAQSIADLREHNIDQTVKIKAVKLNKEGIKHHSSGELDEAILALQKAVKLTPHHISANLNFVQLLLKKMKSTHIDTEVLSQCNTSLNNIRHIKQGHPEYKRYIQIKKHLPDS
jgi:tetratricopeptide (TPR) repeat protein